MIGTVTYVFIAPTHMGVSHGFLENQFVFLDLGFAAGDVVQYELRQGQFAQIAFGLQKMIQIPGWWTQRAGYNSPKYVLPTDPVLNNPRVQSAVANGHW